MANIMDINTESKLEYHFFLVSSSSVQFKVRASNDAHIALTMDLQDSQSFIEIYIGGWGNTKSAIRRSKTDPEKVLIETPQILNGGEYRGFWIRWDGGIISAGREGEVIPFIAWFDPEPFPIHFVGVRSGWSATGSWKIEANPSAPVAAPLHAAPDCQGGAPGYPGAPLGGGYWVDTAGGSVPPGAVVGGQDCNGEPIYVARAQHKGALTPGKLVVSLGVTFVAWGGGEHGKSKYQVLVGGPNNWVRTNGANVPPGAFRGGETEDGEPLFIGRVNHEGSLTTGKVQQSHGVCYISFAGQELGFPDYEVLMP